MKIAINGELLDQEQAVVTVMDHGFLYGIGLFETFRTYGGKPFLLDQHMRRLRAGCQELGIRFDPDLEEVKGQIFRLMKANALQEAYIRYSISAGEGPLGLPLEDSYDKPNCIIYMKPLPPQVSEIDDRCKAVRLLRLKRSSPEGNRRMKSFHYMNNILARRELNQYPDSAGSEGLLLNERGQMTEGIVSKLFFVRDGQCFTPSVETGILPGITRDFVIGLAAHLDLQIVEGLFRWEDLWQADEAFLTNSIQEIVPVNRLIEPDGQSRVLNQGRPGEITRRLGEMYRAVRLREI